LSQKGAFVRQKEKPQGLLLAAFLLFSPFVFAANNRSILEAFQSCLKLCLLCRNLPTKSNVLRL
jgi:hypothetical protein